MKYEPLPTNCDLSIVAMEECARQLGPSFVYTLTVHPQNLLWVRSMLHKISAEVKENPFAPYVNLASDESLTHFEWHLSLGDRAVGSAGA